MVSGESNLRVVWAWQDHAAATGDGTRYEASDGSIWHEARPFEQVDADLIGDRIIRRH